MSDSVIYPPGCPIDVEAKRWLERRLQWLVEHLGAGSFAEGFPLVLPTRDEFPVTFDGSTDAVAALFERICWRMGLNASEFTLVIQPENPALGPVDDDGHAVPLGIGGQFAPHEGGAQIALSAGELNNPAGLVATIAHELSHSVLHRLDRSAADEADHELLTDLTAIHLGFGVFAANDPRDWFSDSAIWPGTELRMPHYMPCSMSAYALALATVVRGDDEGAWMRHLTQDASTNVRAALRYLRATNDVPAALQAALEGAQEKPFAGDNGSVQVVDERAMVKREPNASVKKRTPRRRIHMKGTWRGSYMPDAATTSGSEFTMHLRDGWFGNFTGRTVDDPPGPPEEAEVDGRIDGGTIRFTKSYPHCWVADPGGAIRYEDYLLAKNGLEIEGELEGFDVEYAGDYDEASEIFEGTWQIITFEQTFRAGEKDYRKPAGPGATGRWSMKRMA